MEVVGNVTKNYYQELHDFYMWTHTIADRRVDGWLFMDSIKPTAALICLYYVMVFAGPRIMKDRKPFKLKWPLVIYNMFITFLNLYITIELALGSFNLGYSWFCQPISYTGNPEEMRIVKALYLYYISKCVEFLDSLFFILRKKNNQLSFLHIYHHSTMFFFWWIGVRWVPGGSAWLGPMVNAAIHVLMYSYYGLSVFPSIRKFLWWKQYLTIIQLIQFTGALILGMNAILTGCEFTLWLQYLLVFYMMTFILLFGNFYKNAYQHGVRFAYNAEMKKRELILPGQQQQEAGKADQTNGHTTATTNIGSGETSGLRARGKPSLLAQSSLLAEEVAKHSGSS